LPPVAHARSTCIEPKLPPPAKTKAVFPWPDRVASAPSRNAAKLVMAAPTVRPQLSRHAPQPPFDAGRYGIVSRGEAQAFFLRLRGGPISTGWNSTAAAIVVTSASAINLPMLEVPGWLDSHRLPNAVAVVSALNITARVKLDCRRLVWPARHAIM